MNEHRRPWLPGCIVKSERRCGTSNQGREKTENRGNKGGGSRREQMGGEVSQKQKDSRHNQLPVTAPASVTGVRDLDRKH